MEEKRKGGGKRVTERENMREQGWNTEVERRTVTPDLVLKGITVRPANWLKICQLWNYIHTCLIL